MLNKKTMSIIEQMKTLEKESYRSEQKYFKRCNTACKLFAIFWKDRGYMEAPTSDWSNWDVMWYGSHIKMKVFQGLQPHQKVNHFPRTTEVTRKDRLVRNLNKMKELHGAQYDYFPPSWVWPLQEKVFLETHNKLVELDLNNDDKTHKIRWISKPINLSRGRGITLHSDKIELSIQDLCVIQKYLLSFFSLFYIMFCRYIDQPFLLNEFKFDLRLYVIVTSFQPLRIYLYNDGLVRFATEKYSPNVENKDQVQMHLTNFSINRGSQNFVYTDESNTGSKWLFSALLNHLQEQHRDTTKLLEDIHDLVAKTLIAVEPDVSLGFRNNVPYRWNCFEMFGFDVLLDQNLKPWLLEVNLSPSMSCTTPMDQKIKTQLMGDFYYLNNTIDPQPRPSQFQSQHEMWVWELETEATRCRNFTRVFPKPTSGNYLDFFEVPKEENKSMIAYLQNKIKE